MSSFPRSPAWLRLAKLALTCVIASLPALGVAAGAAAPVELLEAGASFPSWNLPDHTGKERSSGELAGRRYLLWFYPKAMTPG